MKPVEKPPESAGNRRLGDPAPRPSRYPFHELPKRDYDASLLATDRWND
jgi:hypothetical protein